MANTFTISIPAGPIWNDDDAKNKAPIVAAAHGGKWNGQWRTVVANQMSTVDVDIPVTPGGASQYTLYVLAGPIWSNDDAKTKGPVVAASYGGTWTGQWKTVVEGKMSIIECTFKF